MSKKNRLYVHIPFCSQICGYCDFSKLIYSKQYVEPYIQSLISEINSLKLDACDSIYIGGGTPSALSIDELRPLLQVLAKFLSNDCEFTIECNIENTTLDKLALFKHFGINRLSFGVQSFNEQVLHKMNRNHNKSMTISLINHAKEMGFNNINIDLIYGVDDDREMKIWKEDIACAISLNINHISSYSLTVSKGTMFYLQNVKELEDDLSREYYDYLLASLRQANYIRYEVSNFARPNFESKHNLGYWNNEEYYGVGLGASGYINRHSYQNTKNIKEYILGNYRAINEMISPKEELENYLMLKLRTFKGIPIQEFSEKFHQSFEKMFIKSYNKFVKEELLTSNEGFISCTDEGIMILDYILVELFKEMEGQIYENCKF